LKFANLENLNNLSEEEKKEEHVENFSFVNECYFLGLSFVSLAFGTNSMMNDVKKDYEGIMKNA